MTTYTIYNISVALLVAPVPFAVPRMHRWRSIAVAARLAIVITLLAFPWDFFALQMGAWAHPTDPGPRIHGVPLNDLLFIWLASYFTGIMLMASDQREHARQGHPEREDTGEQDARNKRQRTL
jgi:hypothetical protein